MKMEIGTQTYTARDFCKTTEDLSETLKKIADIGYKNVQLSGVCDYDPDWMKEELRKNGLTCVLTHVNGQKLAADPVSVCRDHEKFGCRNIGLGWYDFGKCEDLDKTFAEFESTYHPVMTALKENGKYFMFHNHNGEMRKANDKTVLLTLAEKYAADELGFVLDTYWVQYGGGDPAQYLELLAGRVPCIHLKDISFEQRMEVLGEGNINFDRVFAAAEKAGTKCMLVEQDNCNGEDPFDCMKRSYDYLKSCGF